MTNPTIRQDIAWYIVVRLLADVPRLNKAFRVIPLCHNLIRDYRNFDNKRRHNLLSDSLICLSRNFVSDRQDCHRYQVHAGVRQASHIRQKLQLQRQRHQYHLDIFYLFKILITHIRPLCGSWQLVAGPTQTEAMYMKSVRSPPFAIGELGEKI